ncbi:MAG: hypothetical protein FGM15_10755 [Chthoniobacterales bacterium]|nr:hypothetical protein [Chthoniobacterales bacterium]
MTNEAARAQGKMLLVVLAALVLPIALAVLGLRSMFSGKTVPAEDPARAEAMRDAIERAAETVMPVPSLGTDVATIECPADKLDAEERRILRLARGVGGSASSWKDGETVRVIAKIPVAAESLYREAVTRGFYDLAAAGDEGSKTIVEVVIRAAAPSAKPGSKGRQTKH